MAFSSVIFLFLFLPATLLAWLVSGARVRLPLLVALSFLFAFWGSGTLLLLLAGSVAFNYGFGLAIAAAGAGAAGAAPTRRAKALLALGIAGNLLLLGYFKYLDFALGAVAAALRSAGLAAPAIRAAAGAALPLGISFFTFKAVSYLIDVFRGQAAPARNPLHLAAYVSLFPQLTAGPIGRWTDLGPQLASPPRPDAALFSHGAFRFVFGLAKKVLVADTLGVAADEVFGLDPARVGMGGAWLGAVAYTLQIYFDFSGYSDMAIGVGRMLGLRFAENFDLPYRARSVREFWRRWHISLSTWFRDYLYIPLGGGRVAPHRVMLNLLAVFTLCGLWHGASWTFVAWGLYHGLFLAAERTRLGAALERAPRPAQHLYALLVVTVGWVLFRADSLTAGAQLVRAMFVPAPGVPLVALARYDTIIFKAALLAALVGSTPLPGKAVGWLRLRLEAAPAARGGWLLWAYQGGACVTLALLLVLSAMHVASGSSAPFLYAQF
ncbi:MAG TPA: MBOAT family protein [bacterium]